jgi:DNA-binding beta-propeller fold protein YncE
MKTFFFAIFAIFLLFINLFSHPTFVPNTLKEINACEGKIKLTLLRVWGDEEVDDENQFFRFPSDIKIGKNKLVYIVDSGNHRVQVFGRDGSYKMTIGRKGQGPSDIIQPRAIAIDNDGNCVIADYGNYRIQTIDSKGNYLSSFKTINSAPSDIALTHKNEIAVYSYEQSFISRSIISLFNSKGKVIKQIGKVHDNARSLIDFESIFFTLDKDDNFFIAHFATPLYCKYSNNDKLIMLVTYEMPSKSPAVVLSKSQNEPLIKGEKTSMISAGISVDHEGLVYIVIATRQKYKKEKFYLVGSPGNIRRFPKNIESEKTDRFRLLVFNPAGKVIAAKHLSVFCDRIYVQEDTLFIIDSYMGMKIYEFKISFIGNP